MISAKIIADSMNEFGNRLTTFVLTFPRIVLAEFNTHRMLSRNSASSRAIPFPKMLKMVQENPFIPTKWMKDHSGMQGTEYIEDEQYKYELKQNWLIARTEAAVAANRMSGYGVTKQVLNRLLEPFMWHTVIVTASEWENFFALRAHPDAEIHIQELAHRMLEQYNIHAPKLLKAGEWHIPFGDTIDEERIYKEGLAVPDQEHGIGDMYERKIQIATARCARVSYLNFEGKDDYKADIQLHDRLLESGHMSPFEHCAQTMTEDDFHIFRSESMAEEIDRWQPHNKQKMLSYGWCGNFRGFIQYRKMIQGENKIDNRVKK